MFVKLPLSLSCTNRVLSNRSLKKNTMGNGQHVHADVENDANSLFMLWGCMQLGLLLNVLLIRSVALKEQSLVKGSNRYSASCSSPRLVLGVEYKLNGESGSQCKEGRTGDLCGKCTSGVPATSLDGTCVPRGEPHSLAMTIALPIFIALLAVYLFMRIGLQMTNILRPILFFCFAVTFIIHPSDEYQQKLNVGRCKPPVTGFV